MTTEKERKHQHNISPSQSEQRRLGGIQRDHLQSMGGIIKHVTVEDIMFFEIKLQRLGLIAKLEEAQVLPVASDPNPFDPERDERRHERWWKEHPDEGERFMTDSNVRLGTLKGLYIGMMLGHLLREELMPEHEETNDPAS